MHSRRSEFISGVKAELPIMLGVIPFGMIYGVVAMGAGLPANVAQAMSSIVFAGSAQFVAAQLFGMGTPGLVIVLTAFVVNLRHMLYSASVAPYVKHLDAKWKCLLAYLLTDEAYAVVITRYNRDGAYPATPPNRQWYFLGAGLTLWSTWQASTAVGILLGTQIPSSWALDFTLALTFIALVVPALNDRPSVAAALAAGVVAVVTADLPYKLGLMLAAIIGIVIGLALEARQAAKNDQRVRAS
jgi:4-azaleucine resistance transporter AzlC